SEQAATCPHRRPPPGVRAGSRPSGEQHRPARSSCRAKSDRWRDGGDEAAIVGPESRVPPSRLPRSARLHYDRARRRSAVRLGLTLWGFGAGVRASVELAVLAEQRGFDSVFMVEGVFSNDAVTAVAGMAGRTSRILIGTGIANVYLRHPVMLGLAAAAIAEL